MTPFLSVSNLTMYFHTQSGVVKAVDGVSFDLEKGEVMGLVGESGSGKSQTGYALMGLIDPPGRIVAGDVRFKGESLVSKTDQQWQHIRGNKIAMVFQDPMMTLNPVLRIDTQMIEAVQAHQDVSKGAARARAREVLAKVGIASPDERLLSYPHQFSGGMRQRVAIAIALINDPELIIADEPTTALDVTIQGQILYEMQTLCRSTGTALIWITHDLSVIAGLADQVAVMYAGRIVEQGSTEDVISNPLHPYTRGLMNSIPSRNQRGQPLPQILGTAPSPFSARIGCAFAPRCSEVGPDCGVEPAPTTVGNHRSIRCVRYISQAITTCEPENINRVGTKMSAT